MFTDRDGLKYEIKTNFLYEELYRNEDIFYFSQYLENSKLYNSKNKKVIGKMKDETKSITFFEFVGLKFKMYSLMKSDNKENKKIKVISKDVVEKLIIKNIQTHSKTKTKNKQIMK